jgi:homocysteine S-methyltransferase
LNRRPINPINPLEPFLAQSKPLILDGGLATELEVRGHDLSDELWSARLLVDAPDDIRSLHHDYLIAGADCIISASYQGTIEGFMALGLSHDRAVSLLELSAELATEARDRFWSEPNNRINRLKPIVAASVGPYGAYLADGSEFTGDYDLDEAGLLEFHRERWHILASTGADIIACETIPSLAEAHALGVLLQESGNRFAWLSFSCKDGKHISDGTPLADAAMVADAIENVAAIGINCTAPRHISSLIAEVRKTSRKPVIVYPNSGETYDSEERRWRGDADVEDYIQRSISWRTGGASLIGGCCRTGPEHIRRVRQRLVG